MNAAKKKSNAAELVSIRTMSAVLDRPLPYDLFLKLGEETVHFKRQGDTLTSERATQLLKQGGDGLLFIRDDQRTLHREALKRNIRDPDIKLDEKSRILKEAAFLHVHDLFTAEDIRPVISESRQLVEDMVSMVSSDVAAVATLLGLSRHDYYTYNHSVDVAVYSIVLAKRVHGTDDKELLIKAGLGGLLHDIGKKKIDEAIINKATALTSEEWETVRRHPEFGLQCLDAIGSVPNEAKLIVIQHHENYDGTGYPFGLQGDGISKLARVVMIADVFDALTTERSYHHAVSPREALAIMQGMQPGKFDPNMFNTFDKKFYAKPDVVLPNNFDPCSPTYSRVRRK